jgi:hypothetical protein
MTPFGPHDDAPIFSRGFPLRLRRDMLGRHRDSTRSYLVHTPPASFAGARERTRERAHVSAMVRCAALRFASQNLKTLPA